MFPLAQVVLDVPATPIGTSATLGQQVMAAIAPLVVLFLTAVAGVLSKAAISWLTERAKTSAIANVALKVAVMAEGAVHEVNNVLKPLVVKALDDGVITDAEAKQLKQAALDTIKGQLGAAGVNQVMKTLGLGTPAALDAYLGGVVEKAVSDAKTAASPSP